MKKKTNKTTPDFTHLSTKGAVHMVDVGGKPDQSRRAVAAGRLVCQAATIRLLKGRLLAKGDALAVARIAGIQAAKHCSSIIPLCHPLPLHHVEVEFSLARAHVDIRASAGTVGKTGVEMEALAAVSGAALALYDMMKAADKTMSIERIRVVTKTTS